MISLESGKKYGNFCLYIRTWDGYDKPDYYPVLNITEEEVEFKGGRFERCMGRAKSGIKGQNLYLLVGEPPEDDLEPIVNWVHENTTCQWAMDLEHTFSVSMWRFSFTNEEDAVLFKLTWDAKSDEADIIEERYA